MLVQPGIKIHCNGSDGTLGILVKIKDVADKTYLMSSWHVLDNDNTTGIVKTPDENGTTIANYTRSTATSYKGYDVALAEIIDSTDIELSNKVFNTQRTLRGVSMPKKMMSLRKNGATTNVTRCELDKIMGSWGNLELALRLKHFAGDDTTSEYCKPGDSGAAWWSIQTGRVVGLHARGGFADNRAAAAPMRFIMKKLNLILFKAPVAEAARS